MIVLIPHVLHAVRAEIAQTTVSNQKPVCVVDGLGFQRVRGSRRCVMCHAVLNVFVTLCLCFSKCSFPNLGRISCTGSGGGCRAGRTAQGRATQGRTQDTGLRAQGRAQGRGKGAGADAGAGKARHMAGHRTEYNRAQGAGAHGRVLVLVIGTAHSVQRTWAGGSGSHGMWCSP